MTETKASKQECFQVVYCGYNLRGRETENKLRKAACDELVRIGDVMCFRKILLITM